MEVGESPSFNVRGIDGKPLSLKQFKGKLVVVDFWATWCGPCMDEAQHMVSLNEKYGPRGLQFVGISLDSDQAALRRVIAEQKFTWPQFFDGKGWQNQLAQAWGVNSIPRTFLIGPDGKVLWSGHSARIDAAIEEAFEKTPPQLLEPAVAADVTAKLDAVDAAMKAGDVTKALASLTQVPGEVEKDPTLAKRRDAARDQVDAAAAPLLAEAEKLAQAKQYGDADAKLKALAAALGDTPNGRAAQGRREALAKDPTYVAQRDAAEAAAAQAELEANAARGLAAAQALKDEQKHEQAYVAFGGVAKQFPKTAAGAEAAKAIAAYEADPKFARQVADAAAKGQAQSLLSLARAYRANKRPELANKKYQEIIDRFPKSSFADTARAEMAQTN